MDFKTSKKISNVFSLYITVCSKNSLHAVFDSHNLCNALFKRGKRLTYQKIILSRPRGTQFGFLLVNIYPFTMYCVLYDYATIYSISKKHIIAIKTIYLCPFQEKIHRPGFLLGRDTKVAIMILNILIISKIIF